VDELTGCLGVVYPTFEEYPNRMQEDKVIAYVPQNKDFSYTADDLMAFFAVREVAAILLINPDNPSGNYISKVDVVHLAKWCKDKKVTLVVDESFVDFSEQSVDNTLLTNEILEENPNLVVVKSISKSYGVPGLRLGVLASSNLLLIDRVRKNVPIWNINSFAEFYMQIFNKYEQDYKQACRLFIRERDRFYVDLQQIGYLRIIPSQANYFLCEVISKYSSKELTELLLNEYNILIKDCGTKKAFRNGEYIRIAVRSTLDNQRLIDALKEL
jgi:histidinol-phosphate/aromatic aminotransferase/cobyric acid decarboxylase-like protein